MDASDAEPIAVFIHKALAGSPEAVAPEVAAFRRGFSRLHYIRGGA